MNYKLYMHTSPSGKIYFGITCQTLQRRWVNGKGYIGNDHFTKAINKYGWDNIEHILLADNLTKEEACYYETRLISIFDTTNQDKGYNITKGGEGTSGYKHTEETKAKMRENHADMKGENHPMYGKHLTEATKKKISDNCASKRPEVRKKMSEAAKGRISPMKGRTHTDEAKRKMSDSHVGKTQTEDTRKKISENHKGKPSGMYGKTQTEETRKKISEANLGRKHTQETRKKMTQNNARYWKGKTFSEEARKKMSENSGKAKKVRCIELDIIFSTVSEANLYFGKSYYSNSINSSVKRNGTAFGYHWEYIKEDVI